MENFCKLSDEMVVQFLSRLPPKALLRFKCIRKSWYNLISSPSFVARNLSNSKNNKFASSTSILFKRTVLKDINDQNEIFYILRDNNNDRRDILLSLLTLGKDNYGDDVQTLHSLVEDLIVPLPLSICPFSLQIAGHCDGIICLISNEEVVLCNPSIKEFRFVPRSPLLLPLRDQFDYDSIESHINGVGFGYDSKTQDYKVVRMLLFVTGVCYTLPPRAEVYNLSAHSWREIKIETECFITWVPSFEMYFNGSYYWKALIQPTPGENKEVIIVFDMSDEIFHEISFPDSFIDEVGLINKSLAVWKESVTLIAYKEDSPKWLDIWVMDEFVGAKGSWTKTITIGPFESEIPLAFWTSDDLLMVNADGCVVSYNIGTQTLKYLPICGVEGQQYIPAFVYVNSIISVMSDK